MPTAPARSSLGLVFQFSPLAFFGGHVSKCSIVASVVPCQISVFQGNAPMYQHRIPSHIPEFQASQHIVHEQSETFYLPCPPTPPSTPPSRPPTPCVTPPTTSPTPPSRSPCPILPTPSPRPPVMPDTAPPTPRPTPPTSPPTGPPTVSPTPPRVPPTVSPCQTRHVSTPSAAIARSSCRAA